MNVSKTLALACLLSVNCQAEGIPRELLTKLIGK